MVVKHWNRLCDGCPISENLQGQTGQGSETRGLLGDIPGGN